MLNINEYELDIVKDILNQTVPNDTVWAFGSRINANCKKHSDLDLVIIKNNNQDISISKLRALNELFSESTLPFRVDILDWNSLDESFKSIIKKAYHKII